MFKKKNILVVGDIMLDKYSHGSVSRVSPEAPVPIVDIKKTIYKPGGASNVAQNLSALGMNVTLLGITGDDTELKELIKVLRHSDIKFDPVKDLSIRTTLKSRIIGNDQQLMRLDHEDRNKSNMHSELYKRVIKYAKNSDLIIMSDYDKGSVKPIASDIISFANKKNIKVIIDPKGTDYSIYENAYMVKPNELEFSMIMGKIKNKKDMIVKGKKLKKDLQLDTLLLTLGKNGMVLFSKDSVLTFPTSQKDVYDVTGAGDTVISVLASALASNKTLKKDLQLDTLLLTLGKNGMVLFSKDSVLTFPTSQKDVYDVTGAGDTVISVLASALASNKTLKKSCELANIAAGLSIQHLGTVSISKSDISNAIRKS